MCGHNGGHALVLLQQCGPFVAIPVYDESARGEDEKTERRQK